MCGIAGVIARERVALAPEVVARLTTFLQHRGPDGEGFWADTVKGRVGRGALPPDASVVLGHRRLSIVDLATGGQPMGNEDGSVWVSYNGEIYNQLEIRKQLEASGHRFATSADTEVLVHGWEEWGDGLFGRLNGIFAFALVDERSGAVVLARDPVGAKPLFVGARGPLTWWASELGAARRAGLTSEGVSSDAIKLFLMFRFIPSPHAVFPGTWKVPPGHYVVLRREAAGREPVFRPYSSVIRSSADPRRRAEWREALGHELEQAVAGQLMSDVPVGSLLSGGVDSSFVTLFMDRHLPYHPETFGIGFRSHGTASEAVAGEWAAGILGVPFTPTRIEDADYLAAWPRAFASTGEPIGNSGGLLVHLLCRTVAHTHKVVLSGQGADEPLGGYPRHMVERLKGVGRLAPSLSAWIADRLIGGGAGARLRRVMRSSDRVDRYLATFAVLEPASVDALVRAGAPAKDLGRQAIQRWVGDDTGDDLNDLLRADARLSLADDLLVIADHFSMLASVELRVPFLDLRFLELAERMPSRYKISWLGERKWLYREAAAKLLPQPLANHLCGPTARVGKKLGFATPFERWFEDPASPLLSPRDWLEPLTSRGVFVPEASAVLDGIQRRMAGAMSRELLALYSLSQWTRAEPA